MDSISDNLDRCIKLAQYKEQPLLKKWAPTHNLSLLDGTHWYHGTALVVVADNALRRGVISLFHDHVTAGHAGITKTLQLITPYYWWPNLKTFITEYIKGCATCQMTKVNTHPTHPPMFPITPADNAHPFETIAMDFITKLPQSGGFATILTITDTDCSKVSIFIPCHKCYNPPPFFSSPSDPLLITLPKTPPMAKWPLPVNPSPLPDLPPLPPSEPSKPLSPLDQPPVEPLVPVPWNIHRQEYFSMETYQEPPPVENPLEDPDSPMEDMLPLEPEPVTHYEPDIPEGHMKTLSPQESPIEPWQRWLSRSNGPVSRKHSLSPTSPSSVPIQQRTSCEGSYQSITPSASSPIASTSPQSQGYQSTSSEGSSDNPSAMKSSTDDADSDMALNWVSIKTDYHKG